MWQHKICKITPSANVQKGPHLVHIWYILEINTKAYPRISLVMHEWNDRKWPPAAYHNFFAQVGRFIGWKASFIPLVASV